MSIKSSLCVFQVYETALPYFKGVWFTNLITRNNKYNPQAARIMGQGRAAVTNMAVVLSFIICFAPAQIVYFVHEDDNHDVWYVLYYFD